MRKAFEISLTDFSLINRMISEINNTGIEYMRIGELKHKDISNYRKEVKKQALIEAKEKATYLVETMDKNLGDIISIREANNDYGWMSRNMMSNTTMESSSGGMEIEKRIKLRYEIVAQFEIVDF